MKKLQAVLVFLGLASFMVIAQPAALEAKGLANQSCAEAGASFCSNDTSSAQDMAQKLINALLTVLGAVSVIVIVVGGLKYVTSDGDPGKIKGAKDTILYAVIGLIVAMLAYAIVNFVVGQFAK